LIGVTSFFRDPAVWEQLGKEVLPALLASIPARGTLRASSPACSTGEEAYTLAIVFHEAVRALKSSAKYSLQIFGTDLDDDAVGKARAGIYPANIAADVTQPRLQRYFVQEARGYSVCKEIREMVIFARQSLVLDPPFTKLDILTCRNLLIYLEPELQKKLLPLFHYSLNPGGILVLGTSESPGTNSDLFVPQPGKNRIYRRNDVGDSIESVEFPAVFGRHRKDSPMRNTEPAAAALSSASLQAQTEAILRMRFSPAAVLATDQGDIVYISGKTGKYLEPAAGKANMNLFAMAREGLAGALTATFAKAVRGKTSASLTGVEIVTGGASAGKDEHRQRVNVTVEYLSAPRVLQAMVLVVFADVDSVVAAAPKGKRVAPSLARMDTLAHELQLAHAEVQASREEMQTSQEELKSTNEELQSTNEELQSTNEELTTSKEEMQSMNEELQTVNHELQAKIDEMILVGDDLTNLLDGTDIATLFLDGELRVRRFTAKTPSIIKLLPGDAGRPASDIASDLDYPGMSEDAHEVLRSLVKCEREVPATGGRWFRVCTMPYRTQDNRIDGVVITFVDVSAAKSLEKTLRKALAVLQARSDDQGTALASAKSLESVLRKAQRVLQARLDDRAIADIGQVKVKTANTVKTAKGSRPKRRKT
ncbi:MAG: CheR family methyltransferase, partial [Thermoanaerobaculia bacterium]